MTDLNDVKKFWERNPLWTGESEYEAGTLNFYNEHRNVYIADCFSGAFDIPPPPRHNGQNMKVLDLGCGIGFG